MSFKSLDIYTCYESDINDILEDFYIPTLRESIKYDRIAGYFSSTSLAIASRGIAGLINNGGKMRIIASPRLSSEDIDIIKKTQGKTDDIIIDILLNSINDFEDAFLNDHVKALGWLLLHKLLEIKLALPKDILNLNNFDAMFHQKVGILYDREGNNISFSGSVNKTAKGWLDNIEEFKVFRSWEPGQYIFYKSDLDKFESYWSNLRSNVHVYTLPEAIKNEIIRRAPSDVQSIINPEKYFFARKKVTKMDINGLNLFDYQRRAIDMWLNNDKKLIFEMATGTGKTRAAIGCIVELLNKTEKSLITIIACPQNTILRQWKTEIDRLGIKYDSAIIADGTNTNWRIELEENLIEISLGSNNKLLIFTTHTTSSSKDFINIISKKPVSKFFFIGDEAHGMGALKVKKGLLDIYDYRLGLSATPSRWFDELGTEVIFNYFGDKIFEFNIGDALNTINPITNKPYLVNYYYYPYFTSLTSEELDAYAELSNTISKLSHIKHDNEEYIKLYEHLLFIRSNIHKNAYNKYEIFDTIIENLDNIKDLIVFVSYEQIENIITSLGERGIKTHRFTQAEGTKSNKKYQGRSERQFLIDKFKEGKLQVLVAIKCLDEGIDIPSASSAILMANSTNPREYIQRLGRVLRQDENKNNAFIYDLLIKPYYDTLEPSLREFEKQIYQKELLRASEIAKYAINNAEATYKLNNPE